jgi:hypothetical protein
MFLSLFIIVSQGTLRIGISQRLFGSLGRIVHLDGRVIFASLGFSKPLLVLFALFNPGEALWHIEGAGCGNRTPSRRVTQEKRRTNKKVFRCEDPDGSDMWGDRWIELWRFVLL